jgi:class 3 adenylate cyclase/tetratricopeptide (TPR) repeat protein
MRRETGAGGGRGDTIVSVSDGRGCPPEGDAARSTSVDDLLNRAVAAINRGDRVAATALAGQVLAADSTNTDAEDLLATPAGDGEIRRLTILFADLVDSTVLSTRVEPETYRLLVRRYREQVVGIVNRFEGHIGSTKGDGLLAVFGHPIAHEDDVRRAVLAGLEITGEVARLSAQAQRRFGTEISVRVGVHRGLVYLDTDQDDVYGLAANLAARVSGLAPPGTVVVSDAVAPLIGNVFELRTLTPAAVKGVDEMIVHHQILAEKAELARVGRGRLVGRDRELDRLQRSWARAQAGTLATPGVVFRGEPGIGKSRLVTAAVELVEGSRAAVLELVGSPFHTDAGLYPVRTLLERRCGIVRATEPVERLRLLGAEVDRLGSDPKYMVPLLAPVLGIRPEVGYEPVQAEGRKLYELIGAAVQDYLLACFDGEPGLLIAEDLHWFDPSTVEALGALLHAAEGRLLVVITGRPGPWLPVDWPVKVFDLAALTDEQTDELISALNPYLSEADRAAVARRCDGVPFYIEQLVAGLTESGVPDALYEPLLARLRANANIMPVVQAAGIIGRYIDRGLLGTVVERGDDEVDDVIDELEDALVLEPWGADTWRFRHELLREVACELAPPTVRRGLHAKIADVLVGAGGDPDWRLVAGHYEQAERFDDAAAAYQQASNAAGRRGALAEARGYLTDALAGLDRGTPGPDRDRREMAARLGRGLLAGATEGNQSLDAAADFERCLQLGDTNSGDDEQAVTLLSLTINYFARADLRRAAEVLESLRAGLGKGRRWLRLWVEGVFAVVAWMGGDFDAVRSHGEQATADETAATDPPEIDALRFLATDPIGAALIALAWTRQLRGDLPGADAELARTARRIGGLGFPQGPYMRAFARWVESLMHIEVGQLGRAAVLAAEVTDLGDRHGFDIWQLIGATQQAVVSALATLDDNDPTALAVHVATISTFIDTWRTAGLVCYTTFFDAILGRLLLAVGQPEQARARLDIALALAHDTEMHFYDAELLRIRAQTHTDPEARAADLAAALELARRQGATLFELRSALDDFELRGELARAALVDVIGRMPSNSVFPELARAKAIT